MNEGTLLRFRYDRVLSLYIYKTDNVSIQDAKGFHVFTSHKSKSTLGMNFFECKSGEYISALLICDGELHCVNDSSDEVNCDNMKK